MLLLHDGWRQYSETPGKPVDAVIVDIPFKESYNANTREVVKG